MNNLLKLEEQICAICSNQENPKNLMQLEDFGTPASLMQFAKQSTHLSGVNQYHVFMHN